MRPVISVIWKKETLDLKTFQTISVITRLIDYNDTVINNMFRDY